MNDELLIELVRNRPVLYDLKDRNYLNADCKKRMWQEIGKEMNMDGKCCIDTFSIFISIHSTTKRILKLIILKQDQVCSKKEALSYVSIVRYGKNFIVFLRLL